MTSSSNHEDPPSFPESQSGGRDGGNSSGFNGAIANEGSVAFGQNEGITLPGIDEELENEDLQLVDEDLENEELWLVDEDFFGSSEDLTPLVSGHLKKEEIHELHSIYQMLINSVKDWARRQHCSVASGLNHINLAFVTCE